MSTKDKTGEHKDKEKCGTCNMMAVCALVVLAILLLLWYQKTYPAKAAELFRSSGIGVGQSYTSGATMRFNSEPTGTNQLPYATQRNAQILDAPPGIRTEHLQVDRTTMLTQEDELAKRLYTEQMTDSPIDVVSSELRAAKQFM
jgi:hypothetical protein